MLQLWISWISSTDCICNPSPVDLCSKSGNAKHSPDRNIAKTIRNARHEEPQSHKRGKTALLSSLITSPVNHSSLTYFLCVLNTVSSTTVIVPGAASPGGITTWHLPRQDKLTNGSPPEGLSPLGLQVRIHIGAEDVFFGVCSSQSVPM